MAKSKLKPPTPPGSNHSDSSSEQTENLPAGWVVKYSKSRNGKIYYYNTVTRLSTWKKPQPISDVQKSASLDATNKKPTKCRQEQEVGQSGKQLHCPEKLSGNEAPDSVPNKILNSAPIPVVSMMTAPTKVPVKGHASTQQKKRVQDLGNVATTVRADESSNIGNSQGPRSAKTAKQEYSGGTSVGQESLVKSLTKGFLFSWAPKTVGTNESSNIKENSQSSGLEKVAKQESSGGTTVDQDISAKSLTKGLSFSWAPRTVGADKNSNTKGNSQGPGLEKVAKQESSGSTSVGQESSEKSLTKAFSFSWVSGAAIPEKANLKIFKTPIDSSNASQHLAPTKEAAKSGTVPSDKTLTNSVETLSPAVLAGASLKNRLIRQGSQSQLKRKGGPDQESGTKKLKSDGNDASSSGARVHEQTSCPSLAASSTEENLHSQTYTQPVFPLETSNTNSSPFLRDSVFLNTNSSHLSRENVSFYSNVDLHSHFPTKFIDFIPSPSIPSKEPTRTLQSTSYQASSSLSLSSENRVNNDSFHAATKLLPDLDAWNWSAAFSCNSNLGSREAVIPWFGENSQYKCHCEQNECTLTGQCTSSYRCERGWFGPECQYVDLAAKTTYSNNSIAHILTDGRDDTCVDRGIGLVTITLNKVYHFTWMRIYTKRATACFDVSIHFSPSKPTGCIKINDPSGFFDVYCDYPGAVSSITLSGPCTYLLCSVYVSGGRNVALKGGASQNGFYEKDGVIYGPHRSVDGNTNGDFYTGKSCSSTQPQYNSNHWWKVTFKHPMKIYRYIIYNRLVTEPTRHRIKGYHLETLDKAGHIIFRHVDDNEVGQNVYEFMDWNNSQPAEATTIKTFNVDTLNFCEMEIYGDTRCDYGFYGRECKQRCNSNCAGDYCFPSTGACPSGCKPGYIGISCQKKSSDTKNLEMFKRIFID